MAGAPPMHLTQQVLAGRGLDGTRVFIGRTVGSLRGNPDLYSPVLREEVAEINNPSVYGSKCPKIGRMGPAALGLTPNLGSNAMAIRAHHRLVKQ